MHRLMGHSNEVVSKTSLDGNRDSGIRPDRVSAVMQKSIVESTAFIHTNCYNGDRYSDISLVRVNSRVSVLYIT